MKIDSGVLKKCVNVKMSILVFLRYILSEARAISVRKQMLINSYLGTRNIYIL